MPADPRPPRRHEWAELGLDLTAADPERLAAWERHRRVGRVVVAVVVSIVWLGAFTLVALHHGRGFPVLFPLTFLLVFALAGPAFRRGRRERLLEAQRRLAQRQTDAAQAERLRIARELHDVLAHSLSLINVQASVGLHLFEQQPEKAQQALATIKDTSKTALAEVRQVLGVLRAEGAATAGDTDGEAAPLVPEPGLARLGELLAEARTAGLEVELRGSAQPAGTGETAEPAETSETAEPGQPNQATGAAQGSTPSAAPQAVQSALYRIVQEALSNVRKHAEARHVVVELSEDDAAYAVTVTDDGRGPSVATDGLDAGPGNGLLGMRERAELLGGSFTAGPGPQGGFAVSARIPKAGRP